MHYFTYDDIVQISSPPGKGVVGIIRLSGPNALTLASRITVQKDDFSVLGRGVFERRLNVPLSVQTGPATKARRLYSCPARCFVMPEPASYTRENVVEIHLPGSPAILAGVMTALGEIGARAAAPGEFTFRAFRNGRLTLAQAEAVEETIRAGNAAEAKAGLDRLGDQVPERLLDWRDAAMEAAASLEAALDFDEAELGSNPTDQLAALVNELTAAGVGILSHAKPRLETLPHVALVGLSNAGKSSLLNALTGRDDALVSSEASTTRDNLRREIEVDGYNFILSDNPGHDPSASGSAGEAASRSMERLGGEDVACWVIDGSQPFAGDAATFAQRLSGKVVVVLNKSDLPPLIEPTRIKAETQRHGVDPLAIVRISTITKEGLEELRLTLFQACSGVTARTGWNHREGLELAAALNHCRQALLELSGPGRLEIAAEELRSALAAFSRAVGENYAEEALGRIFSRFCLGK